MKKKRDIILVGGGGHCKSVIDIIENGNEFSIIGIIDTPEKVGESVLGYPIIGDDSTISKWIAKDMYFHISLGQIHSNEPRIKLFNMIKNNGGTLPIIKAPDAYVSKHSKIGPGVLIAHKAIINAGVSVGENTIINSGALIEHDSKIGAQCHISTLCAVNADCEIKDGSFLSSHVVINRGCCLPPNSIVYSGAIVTQSFHHTGIRLKGIPAKPVE